MSLRELLGVELPIIQFADGGGARFTRSPWRCAMLVDSARCRRGAARGRCVAARVDIDSRADGSAVQRQLLLSHAAGPDAEREAAWRARLKPYYDEFNIDATSIVDAGGSRRRLDRRRRMCWKSSAAVVSFHFGLPSAELFARVKGWGSKVLSSATTVDEARWLDARRRCDHRTRIRGGRAPRHVSVG